MGYAPKWSNSTFPSLFGVYCVRVTGIDDLIWVGESLSNRRIRFRHTG
jgi:hypothetical protein